MERNSTEFKFDFSKYDFELMMLALEVARDMCETEYEKNETETLRLKIKRVYDFFEQQNKKGGFLWEMKR